MTDMTQGTLHQVRKKKIFQVRFITKKGKEHTVNVPKTGICFQKTDFEEGMAVDIELKGGLPVKVTIPGKKEVKPAPMQKPAQQNQGQYNTRHTPKEPPLTDATAPYNFVPFSSQNVLTGFEKQSEQDEKETWSGKLQLQIKTLSPLLVADEQSSDGNNRRFFKLNDKETIPGTSIKGMIRSLLEILSFSRMAPVNTGPLFQRDIRDKKNYMSSFIKTSGSKPIDVQMLVKAGYLYAEGSSHYIYPCDVARVEASLLRQQKKRQFENVPYSSKASSWGDNRTISFDLDRKESHTHGGGSVTLHYKKLERIHTKKAMHSGELVFTGTMNNKHMEYVFYNEKKEKLPVPPKLYARFESQITKHQEDKIKDCKNKYGRNGKGLPVFYLTTGNNEIDFFGLAQLFRYPFAKEVKDIIAQEDIIGLDFCQSLFGTVNDGAVRGRIAFSHCNITRKTDSDSYKTVLGKPQATCSAHYLEQDRSKVSAKDNQYDSKKKTNIKLTDCNSPSASSRGRKLYWHRDVDCVPPPNDNENVVSELHPVGKDSIFTSTVYLDRVSTLEIGGLLKALELPDGHAHKLGLAKSMGFGSVRITVKESKLYCDQQRYTSLSGRFGGNGEEVDYNACRQLFEKEILAGLAQKGRNENSFEELAEIKTLRIMMDYNNRPPKEHTAMMPLQYDKTNPEKPCYTRKAILRTPEEIRRINSR